MARYEDLVIILDDPRDSDNLEVGMYIVWIDRREGAVGFSDITNNKISIAWYKFLYKCRKNIRKAFLWITKPLSKKSLTPIPKASLFHKLKPWQGNS